MKISDEISLSARNLLRRKGRTALTLVGVVIGTCMVVLMISLGIAQTKTNEEMLQSWGDLTQVQQRHGAARGLPGDGNRNPVRLLRRGHAPVPPNGAGRHAGVPVHNRIKRIKAKLKPTHSCVSHRIVLYFTP